MGLLEMLASSKKMSPKKSTDGNKLHWIDMSRKGYEGQNGPVPANRGTIKFLPVIDLGGVPVKYAYDVYSYNYEGEENSTWTRFMDPDTESSYDMELSEEQRAKIKSARSLISYYSENIGGFPDIDFKNYALMFGYVLEHVSSDGTKITNQESRKMALLIFPSKNFAKAMTGCLQDMASLEEMGNQMYDDLFSRNLERHCYLSITFDKSEQGFGYDCTIQAKPIDIYAKSMLTADECKSLSINIPEDKLKLAPYLSAVFFAGNHDDNVDFDEEYCDNVIDQLKTYIDQVKAEEQASENLPPIPSKNKKKKSDLDE